MRNPRLDIQPGVPEVCINKMREKQFIYQS